MLERLVTICSVFRRIDDSGSKPCRRRQTVYAIRIAVNRFFSDTAHLKKSSCRQGRLKAIGAEGTNGGHAVDGGSMLSEVRSDRCRGASRSEQLDGKKLRRALGSAIGTERIPVFWTSSTWLAHSPLSTTIWLDDSKV